MTEYAIAELAPEETGGFAPRGACKQLWQTRDFERMLSGPAESGKTFACCQYLDALLWKYPGAQGVMGRKTYASLIPSAVRTYLRVIGAHTAIKAYGGEKPQWFDYPQGSRLWIAGMDNPGKALSSERDFFYFNQAEELDLADWEIAGTRCTGRGAVMPYTLLFGDCNPGPPTHWIKARANLKLLESRHEDNPTLFDDDGRLTEQGGRSMAVLDALTGVRYLRLRKGVWAGAEGQIYEEWDDAIHLIDRFEIPRSWPRFRSIDFGFTNPFVCQWWAQDPDGRLYLYREIYHSQRIVSDHAIQIKHYSQGERIEATVADHDAEDRATLLACGIPTIAAHKAVQPGIEAVQKRLRKAGDARPRLFILKDSLVEVDQSLKAEGKPFCTSQEFPGYIWLPAVEGRAAKEEPRKLGDHGADCTKYMVAHFDVKPVAGRVLSQAIPISTLPNVYRPR